MKLLIGGSPCTHWSIAQTKNRETEASGIGWELFLNYRIALDKYQPDFFLYENNKSMAPDIKAQISKELGVEPVLINSALVSAQNRQRLYWVGKRESDGTYSQVPIEQPEDRGILLRDILETGVAWSEKSYCITATEAKGSNPQQTLTKHRRTMVAEPIVVNGMKNGKARTVDAHMGKLENNLVSRINNPNQAKQQYDCIAEPVRIGTIESKAKNTDFDSQQYRVYSPDGKSVTLCGQGGGVGAKTGLYAVPVPEPVNETVDGKACVAMPVGMATGPRSILVVTAPGKSMPVYEVRNGRIAIKGKTYPIKLADGFYIIRKLTVTECKRLQTVPEEYVFPVSNSQAYKMLGNGWTVDVIAHIMSHFDGLTKEPVEVLSMYDGMSCGHIALDKLGVQPWLLRYYATEIDKYAIQTTQHNFPDTVQLGDAFQVRNDDWRLGDEL
jgi:DNA (cytosine-5)-methyltransferase 3A